MVHVHVGLSNSDIGGTRWFPVTEQVTAVVEQAKGVLMLRYGVSSYEALAALAQWSRMAQVPLTELSRALVTGVCQGHLASGEGGLVRWLEHQLRRDLPQTTGDRTEPPDGRGAPASPPLGGRRRWRYASAVHAAQGLVAH